MQFIDLGAQRARISGKIDAAVNKVIADGRYILGPEVAEFEKRLAITLALSMSSPAPTAPTRCSFP